MNSEQQYMDIFTGCREILDSHSAGAMNALRDKAFEDFTRQGFPTQKVERYKYTDVPAAFAPDYGLNLNRVEFPVNPYEAFRCDVPNLSTSLYFVVNDAFYRKSLPAAALPEGVVVERTLQVVNILRSDVDLMANRRVLVVLEENAQARLLFCDHAMDDRNFLTTQVVEVFAAENARLELYELEETHVKNRRFSNMYVRQQRGSVVNLYNITLHNGQTRNRTDLVLDGEGAESNLYGCVIADKEQRVDNNTLIDHRAEHCVSNQLYKYVMDERSVGAFAGRILVRQGAQHTISNERNANLCATKEARMYSQPMLEIYADDVKCSHGSTVGQLNEQALFYMQQRGISREEAQMLLKFAFAGEVIDAISLEALRDRLHHLVEKRFRGELSRCSGCKLCK